MKINELTGKYDPIVLYRGVNVSQEGSNWYTPDKEWARQFTQSGRDSEIKTLKMSRHRIYRHDPLPKAYGFDEGEVDAIIEKAAREGYSAVWMDEGHNQPDSVFLIPMAIRRKVREGMKINELRKYQKGPWKKFKHPTATDKPEQYVGGWEEYTKPQGIGAKQDPKVTKGVKSTGIKKRKKSKLEASIGPLVTRGDTGTGGHGTPTVPPKDFIGHEVINPPEEFPPHNEAPTSFVKKQVRKLNTDTRQIDEMVRRPLSNEFTADYEVKDGENLVGIGRVTDGMIELLSVKSDIKSEAFSGNILSRMVGVIIRDADLANANLSIKLVNAEDTSMKRFLERFGFRETSEGVMKRNAGSIHPPSVPITA